MTRERKPFTAKQKAADAARSREYWAGLDQEEKERQLAAARKRAKVRNKKVSDFTKADTVLNQKVKSNRVLLNRYPALRPVLYESINEFKQNQKYKKRFLVWVREEVKRLHKLPIEGIKNVSANNLLQIKNYWNKAESVTQRTRIAYGYKA